jgi:hypothetical protein
MFGAIYETISALRSDPQGLEEPRTSSLRNSIAALVNVKPPNRSDDNATLEVYFDRTRFLWRYGFTDFVNILAEDQSPGIETIVVLLAYQVLRRMRKSESGGTGMSGLRRALVVSLYTALASQLCFGFFLAVLVCGRIFRSMRSFISRDRRVGRALNENNYNAKTGRGYGWYWIGCSVQN